MIWLIWLSLNSVRFYVILLVSNVGSFWLMIQKTHIPHPASIAFWPLCLAPWKFTETGETTQPLEYGRNAQCPFILTGQKISLAMFKSILKQKKQQNPLNTVASSILKEFNKWPRILILLIFVYFRKGPLSKKIERFYGRRKESPRDWEGRLSWLWKWKGEHVIEIKSHWIGQADGVDSESKK